MTPCRRDHSVARTVAKALIAFLALSLPAVASAPGHASSPYPPHLGTFTGSTAQHFKITVVIDYTGGGVPGSQRRYYLYSGTQVRVRFFCAQPRFPERLHPRPGVYTDMVYIDQESPRTVPRSGRLTAILRGEVFPIAEFPDPVVATLKRRFTSATTASGTLRLVGGPRDRSGRWQCDSRDVAWSARWSSSDR